MRQLFVPACVCLMTFTGSTGGDSKLSLEAFGGERIAANEATAAAAEPAAATAPKSDAVTEAPATNARSDSDDTPATRTDPPIDIPVKGVEASKPAPDVAAPLPRPKPEIKPVVWRSREEICNSLTKAAQENDLPTPFFIRLLFQESGFHPAVVSSAGAQGIAQFMPETAAGMGVDNPFDPLQAIPASARLLRNLFERFGNLGLAAAAYNAGPKRIHDWLAKKGVLPQETQGYVKTITGRPAENWRAVDNGTPAVKLPRRAPCQEAAGLLAWNGPEQIPVPSTAPHRRAAETVTAAAQPTRGAKLAHRVAHAKAKAQPAIMAAEKTGKSNGKRQTGAIAVAAKPAESRSKGSLQLAARKHDKSRKVRVSSAR